MLKKLFKIIDNPNIVALKILYLISFLLEDKIYLWLFCWFNSRMILNFKNPKTFNDKLNWLKINDRKKLYTKLADKIASKKFVLEIIGEEYVASTYGVWESVESIDWQSLPKQFVIKANHDSSGAVIVRDKHTFDIHRLDKYKKILKRNYYYSLREWPYKNIKPLLFVEELLDDGTQLEDKEITLQDYKFWCFNGEPKYMYITVKDKEIYENFYDMEFKPVNINHGFPKKDLKTLKPKEFEKMAELAGKLSKASQTAFVRVDFFYVKEKIYFSEFTFYDWGGVRPFESYEQDLELGNLINLDCLKKENNNQ